MPLLIPTLVVCIALGTFSAQALERGELFASRLLGMEVLDAAGEEVGQLEDLAIDRATGTVAFAVLEVDELDRRVALPLDSFVVGMYDEVLVLDRPAALLREVPQLRAGAASGQGGTLIMASALLREPRVQDLVVDLGAARVGDAVLAEGRTDFRAAFPR